MSNIKKVLLLFLLLMLKVYSSMAYTYSISLTNPYDDQTEITGASTLLSWQVTPTVTSSYTLKYILNVVTIEEDAELPENLSDYCGACTPYVQNTISFASESGSYLLSIDNCTHYAWQVTLIEEIPESTDPENNVIPASQNIIGQSPVYTFSTICSSSTANRLGSKQYQYITFPAEYTSYVYGVKSTTPDNKLCFKYESVYNNETLRYSIYNNKRNSIEDGQGEVTLKKGVNYVEIILPDGVTTGDTYFFDVLNAKDLKQTLKFRIEP